jgi:hypothetical protein
MSHGLRLAPSVGDNPVVRTRVQARTA